MLTPGMIITRVHNTLIPPSIGIFSSILNIILNIISISSILPILVQSPAIGHGSRERGWS